MQLGHDHGQGHGHDHVQGHGHALAPHGYNHSHASAYRIIILMIGKA